MRSAKPYITTLIMVTARTLTILQPEIAYAGVFDFLTSKETKGWQGINCLERNEAEVQTHLQCWDEDEGPTKSRRTIN